jgi:hypothetical protein
MDPDTQFVKTMTFGGGQIQFAAGTLESFKTFLTCFGRLRV